MPEPTDFVDYLQQHVGHEVFLDMRPEYKLGGQSLTIREVNRGWVMAKEEPGKTIPDVYIPYILSCLCVTCTKADPRFSGSTD